MSSASTFEGEAPASSFASIASTPVSRRELFIWFASILCVTAVVQTAMHSGASLEFLADDLAGISVFRIIGWFAVLRLLVLERSAAAATRQDMWATGVFGAMSLMPAEKMLWITASLAAVYIYVCNQRGSNGRAGATVLGALCVQSLWGPTLFHFFSVFILKADAALVGVALDMTQSGFLWHDNVISTEGHSVEIYEACSSFHNVSLAALCWITLTKLNRPTFIKSDFLFGTAGCVAMIALNAARLFLMALSHANYLYWHDGFGAEIFAVSSSLIIAVICVWGASVRHE
jgi:Transmembrane exosortase (Exosortase_EpsH)